MYIHTTSKEGSKHLVFTLPIGFADKFVEKVFYYESFKSDLLNT